MRHRDHHLVSDFVGPPSWCRGGRHLGSEVVGAAILDLTSWGRHLGPEVVGAAILDRKSWGPPSWTGSDVKCAIVGPILLALETSPGNFGQPLFSLSCHKTAPSNFSKGVLSSVPTHDFSSNFAYQ